MSAWERPGTLMHDARVTPEQLARLSTLLEQALSLDPAERGAWLTGLRAEDAVVAGTLERLLSRQARHETGDWLGRGAVAKLALQPAAASHGELTTLPPHPAHQASDASQPAASVRSTSGFEAGQRVGPYRLLQPLGRGGMGEVWQAERADGAFTRQVALKLPLHRARSGVLAERFARERDIVASLVHPHISRLYDAGVDAQGQPWLALELVQGQPIQRACDERGLDAAARIGLLLQLLSAVQHAHAALVIHRDIKPGNVLVDAQGRAMLLDFGIAKLLADEHASAEETELTREAGRAMSLAYAAPEQIEGRPLGTACDLWALGVLLYELLAGRRPFVQGHAYAMAQAILSDEPARLDRSAGALAALPASRAAELGHILAKALRKNPAERYASAAAFAEDLQRWLDQRPVQAQPESWRYRSGRFVARHRAAVLGATAALLALLVATGVSLQQAGVAREQSRLAQTEAATARAVQDFLEGIFRASSGDQADPVKARQRTAKELLDEGAARIEGALADAPAAKLRVLHTLAEMYMLMQDSEALIPLRRQAVSLAAQQFPGPSAERVLALSLLSTALGANARVEEAGRVLAQAQSLADANPDLDGGLRVRVGMATLQWHMRRDDTSVLPAAARLLAFLRQRPADYDRVGALLMTGRLERVAGRPAPAAELVREAIATAARIEGGAASGLATLHGELATALRDLGDLVGAEKEYRSAVAHALANNGRHGFNTINWTANLAFFLAHAGRPREALAVLAEAGWPPPSSGAQAHLRWLMVNMAVLHRRGLDDQAFALEQSKLPGLRARVSDPLDEALLDGGRARLRMALGRPQEAAALLRHAIARAASGDVKGSAMDSWMLELVGALAASGESQAAALAWGEFVARPATHSLKPVRHAIEARLRLSQGDHAGAESLALASLQELETGAELPDTVYARIELLQTAAASRRLMGRPATAEALLQRALDIDQPLSDPQLSIRRLGLLTALLQVQLEAGTATTALAPLRRMLDEHKGSRLPAVDAARRALKRAAP
jgi:hypothetical protein